MGSMSLKRFSVVFPLAASLAAIGIVVGKAVLFGIVHEADEGADAHLFQLLMVSQVPVVTYFAIVWLPQAPKAAIRVLGAQAGAIAAAFAAVFFLT